MPGPKMPDYRRALMVASLFLIASCETSSGTPNAGLTVQDRVVREPVPIRCDPSSSGPGNLMARPPLVVGFSAMAGEKTDTETEAELRRLWDWGYTNYLQLNGLQDFIIGQCQKGSEAGGDADQQDAETP